MVTYKDFNSMYSDNVGSRVVPVFNWVRETSPGVFAVKRNDDWFGDNNEICKVFESSVSAMPGRERTIEVVVEDKYVDAVEPAMQEFCDTYYRQDEYFARPRYLKIDNGHYAFDYGFVISSLTPIVEREASKLDEIIHKHLKIKDAYSDKFDYSKVVLRIGRGS